jgi:hypothetical protein
MPAAFGGGKFELEVRQKTTIYRELAWRLVPALSIVNFQLSIAL